MSNLSNKQVEPVEFGAREFVRSFGMGGLYAAMIGTGVLVATMSVKTGAEVAMPMLEAAMVKIHDGEPANKPTESMVASLNR